MWAPFRNLFSRPKGLSVQLGDVVFESKAVCGQVETSQFQLQVKRGPDEKSYFVCIKMKADGSAGRDGAPTNYINFDLPTALKVRADIDECIAIARHFASPDSATG